jgi:hypothetical protein
MGRDGFQQWRAVLARIWTRDKTQQWVVIVFLGACEKPTKNSGVMVVAFAAVAAWQIYDMTTATEAPAGRLRFCNISCSPDCLSD